MESGANGDSGVPMAEVSRAGEDTARLWEAEDRRRMDIVEDDEGDCRRGWGLDAVAELAMEACARLCAASGASW